MKEAWRALKGWYRLAEDQHPPACPETMVKQRAKRVELYVRAPPMGAALPHNFLHFEVSDDMPTDKVAYSGKGAKEQASRRGYWDEG